MNDTAYDVTLRHAFECFRFDSSASGVWFPVPRRSHYCSEIIMAREGTLNVVRGSLTHELKPGELIYIAPLIPHSIDSADGGPVVFDVIKFSATRLREMPSYMQTLRSVAADAAQIRLPIHMTAEEVEAFHLGNIVQECVTEFTRQDFGWDLHIRGLIYLLITGMARFWLYRRKSFSDLLDKPRDPILNIPAYIEQHISEPLRVEELAAQCGMSYPWFAKRFHEYFGLSCKQLIERLRVEAAEQYLVYSELDLAEISRRTGFTDSSHMVKDFRRLTGMTPGQFRSVMKIQGQAPFSRFSREPDPNHPPKG